MIIRLAYPRWFLPQSKASVSEPPPVDWFCDMPAEMYSAFNTFLLVLAAIFPVVNPPGSASSFLG